MSLDIQKNLLLCVLTLLLMHNVLGVHVNIKNKLADHLDLTVHCKSKDDDIGIQVLRPGESFGWSFGISMIGQTQFYCSFKWNGDELKWYDVYIARRDYDVCDTCNYEIFQSGPCIILTSKGGVCYGWN